MGFGSGFGSGSGGDGVSGGGSGSGVAGGPVGGSVDSGVGGTAAATPGVGGAGETAGSDGMAVGIDGADGGVIGANGTDAVAKGKDGADSVGEKSIPQTRRFLQVKNESDTPYTVLVQYRSKTEDGLWVWVPADPEESQKALRFQVAPGQAMYLEVNGKRLATSRVRLWAVSAKKSWNEYRTTDLWLVPETDEAGEHVYMAPEVGTFTFVIPRAETTAKTE